jgi:hypothetical protein
MTSRVVRAIPKPLLLLVGLVFSVAAVAQNSFLLWGSNFYKAKGYGSIFTLFPGGSQVFSTKILEGNLDGSRPLGSFIKGLTVVFME